MDEYIFEVDQTNYPQIVNALLLYNTKSSSSKVEINNSSILLFIKERSYYEQKCLNIEVNRVNKIILFSIKIDSIIDIKKRILQLIVFNIFFIVAAISFLRQLNIKILFACIWPNLIFIPFSIYNHKKSIMESKKIVNIINKFGNRIII